MKTICPAVLYSNVRGVSRTCRPSRSAFRWRYRCTTEFGLLESNPFLDNKEYLVVVVSSDNGPHATELKGYLPSFFGTNGGLRGHKRSLLEGGIRVPTLIRWRGRIPADEVTRTPFNLYKLSATFADAAGLVTANAGSKQSMLPVWISGDQGAPQAWQMYSELCMPAPNGRLINCVSVVYNSSDWKTGSVWKLQVSPDGKSTTLYDLKSDPREMNPGNNPQVTDTCVWRASIRLNPNSM